MLFVFLVSQNNSKGFYEIAEATQLERK